MSNYPDFWKGSFFPTTFKEMDRFFDEWGNRRDGSLPSLRPKCEVSEDKNQYFFKIDLPGIPKDQIKIEFHDQVLTISGERRQEKRQDAEREHLSEFSYGSFMRSFSIPGPVRSESIQANYNHGVLEIQVPKSEVTKAKSIPVR